jgi:hypothetical protein
MADPPEANWSPAAGQATDESSWVTCAHKRVADFRIEFGDHVAEGLVGNNAETFDCGFCDGHLSYRPFTVAWSVAADWQQASGSGCD